MKKSSNKPLYPFSFFSPSIFVTQKLFRTIVATSLAGSLASADQIWDGGGADNNWNTAENWGGDTLPNFGNAITFTGITQTTNVNNLTAGTSIGGINFTNTADSAFTLTGNSITLGGTIQTSANTSGSTFTDVIGLNIAIATSANRSIIVNQQNASVQHNLTISGNISTGNSAGTAFTKSGSGVLTLSGSNSGVQEYAVSLGTLVFQGAASTGSGPIRATTGGTARFVSDTNFTSGAGLRNYSGTGNFVFDRATAGSGAGLTFAFTNAGSGNFDFAHNTVNNFTAGANITSGTPTVTLNNMRSQSVTSAQAIQLLPVGVNLSIGAVTVGGSSKLRTWDLGGTSQGNIITGAISNAGGTSTTAVTKSNSSTWTLTGASSYSGATTINAGTLRVNNTTGSATGTGTVTVNAGTLGGTGSISGAVTIGNGTGSADAILAPGVTIESLATGNLTFASDGSYSADLDASSVTSDQAIVTGTVTINPTATLSVNLSGSPVDGHKYFILLNNDVDEVAGTFAGFAQDSVVNTSGGIDLKISYTGNSASGDLTGGNDIVLYAVNSGFADPYATWSSGAPFASDANNDGVANGLAFLLGAASPTATATNLLPASSQASGNLTLTFTMLNAAGRGTSTLALEHSSDLGVSDAWSSVTVPDTSGTVSGITFTVTPGSPLNTVTATIPASEAAAGKVFGRLKAQTP